MSEQPVCKIFDKERTGSDYKLPAPPQPASNFGNIGQLDPRDRFTNTRFVLQGSVEIAILKYLSVFVMAEGVPGQSQRQQYRSIFDPAFTDNDFYFYFRVGATLKF
jgi:hypothetical protein